VERPVRRIAVLALLAGCGSAAPSPAGGAGGAVAPPPAPPPSVGAEPAAARPHRVALSVIAPEPAATHGAIAPDGTFWCRDTWTVSPPADEQRCLADGTGITARALLAVGPDGAQRAWLDAPIELRRISQCGNAEAPVRRPTRAQLERAAPDLAGAPPASGADLAGASFVSCAAPDLALEVPHDAELAHEGSLLRVRAPTGGHVHLSGASGRIASWTLSSDACRADLALEILCTGERVVVSGGPIACDGPGLAITTTSLPCTPESSPVGPAFASFARIAIDGAGTAPRAIAIAAPRFDTAR
jgi:hypothetical protein